MEVLRILNALRYDRRKQRFNSLAFKPFGKPPGISVIDTACIQDMGNTPCSHIRQYYDRIAGAPPIFWKFHTDLLPDQCVIEQEDSLTGDVCHYNIHGLSEKQAREFFLQYAGQLHRFQICDPTGQRPLEQNDLA